MDKTVVHMFYMDRTEVALSSGKHTGQCLARVRCQDNDRSQWPRCGYKLKAKKQQDYTQSKSTAPGLRYNGETMLE